MGLLFPRAPAVAHELSTSSSHPSISRTTERENKIVAKCRKGGKQAGCSVAPTDLHRLFYEWSLAVIRQTVYLASGRTILGLYRAGHLTSTGGRHALSQSAYVRVAFGGEQFKLPRREGRGIPI